MDEKTGVEQVIGLADFLSDLRAELAAAASRAEGDSLKLAIEQLTVQLDVGVTVGRESGLSAAAKAKFWVFASAEGKVDATSARQRMSTQRVTLTLKPRLEVAEGTRGVDVDGAFASDEERPEMPRVSD